MSLTDPLREPLEKDNEDVWENERTPTPVRRLGVCLHAAGLSIRETVGISRTGSVEILCELQVCLVV